MALFKNKLSSRIVLAKTIGFVFGLLAFLVIPFVVPEADLMFRLGILLLYTTIGGLIGVFGIMDTHPIINCKIPFWIRGTLIGSVLNTIVVLFAYDYFAYLLDSTSLSGYSPFIFVIEGFIIGLIIDFIATKYFGEGKELVE